MTAPSNARWNALLIEAFPRRSKKGSKLKCPCRNSKCKYNTSKGSKIHSDLTLPVAEKIRAVESPPTSPKGQLILEFISTIEHLKLRFSWAGFLPSRIGCNAALDAATRAVIEAYKYRNRKDQATANRECQSYVEAVSTLRTDIDYSDDSLATVALLTLREIVLGRDVDSVVQHEDGIAAILLARPRTYPISVLARAILFECCRLSKTGKPIATGEPSPFQDTYWEDLEPAYPFPGTLSNENAWLRTISHKVSIRFPGLIASVRSVRNGTADAESIQSTFVEARRMYNMRDDEAEKAVLRTLKPALTLDKLDRAVIPQSFTFRTPNEVSAMLSYWLARAIVVRNCLALISSKNGQSFRLGDGEDDRVYTAAKLAQEQSRIATNILMSWQYSTQHKLMVLLRAPLKTIWGIFAPEKSQDSSSKSPVQTWLMTKLRELGLPDEINEKQLDMMSGALAGGPIRPDARRDTPAVRSTTPPQDKLTILDSKPIWSPSTNIKVFAEP